MGGVDRGLFVLDWHIPTYGRIEACNNERRRLDYVGSGISIRCDSINIGNSVAFNVKDGKTTVELIKTLLDMYEKASTVNKVYLIRSLFELEMIWW